MPGTLDRNATRPELAPSTGPGRSPDGLAPGKTTLVAGLPTQPPALQAKPGASLAAGPVQGMFEDLGSLFDPMADAAGRLWDALTGDDAERGHAGGLTIGDAAVVTDPDARLRDPATGWKSTGATIPPGTAVIVRAIDGAYVQLATSDGAALGWTKSSNLDTGGAKTKGDDKGNSDDEGPATPEAPLPAPELPATDDAWQDLMADARADVKVTESYSIPTRALNPDLLFTIRTADVASRDEFYDVLTRKSEKTQGKAGSDLTPGRLAYRLGDELQARAEAASAAPLLLASKLALIAKAAPAGSIDIKKNAGGTLRAALGKELSATARAPIDAWIKGHYKGARLTMSADDVAELRTRVTTAVSATATDPERDARIEALRADIVACEARVRTLLRTKATDTKTANKRALWGQLADMAETAGVFVDRTLASYTIEHEDGSDSTLAPALAISVNYLNPGGFKNGGGKYNDATVDSVLADVYAGDPDQADRSSAAKKFIHTLNRNEGGPASMNTWDGEIVSAGPGLSGSGRLQKSMFEYKAADPGGFHDALGKFGIDIVRAGKQGNPYFTVRVPADVQAIPAAMREIVTPGQFIVGSASTGASKGSAAYEECAALRYISKDPVLMARFMYAGQHSYQRFLLKEAAASMHKAETFSFLVGEQRIGWEAMIEPLGKDWLAATQAVIAYRYHASSSTYEGLKVKAADFYAATFGADRDPDDLSTEERKQMGRFVAWQLKPNKYAVYRQEFPSVADDVFPPAKADKADKADKANKADDADEDDATAP